METLSQKWPSKSCPATPVKIMTSRPEKPSARTQLSSCFLRPRKNAVTAQGITTNVSSKWKVFSSNRKAGNELPATSKAGSSMQCMAHAAELTIPRLSANFRIVMDVAIAIVPAVEGKIGGGVYNTRSDKQCLITFDRDLHSRCYNVSTMCQNIAYNTSGAESL